MPLLSVLRALSIGTLLGPRKERQVNWYLQPVHQEKLLGQLMPQLDKIAQIIQNYAICVRHLPRCLTGYFLSFSCYPLACHMIDGTLYRRYTRFRTYCVFL